MMVTVTDADLTAAIASAGNSAGSLVISTNKEQAKLVLTGRQVELLSALPKKSTVVFSAGGSSVVLPLSLMSLAPSNSSLELEIKPAADSSAFVTALGNGKLIGQPVSFEADWTTAAGRKPVDIPNHLFITRTFTVPGSFELDEAGVLYEEDGAVSPVASILSKQADGTTKVTVSRPGFSVYALATRTVNFTDLDDSAAARVIEALAGKWIINGTSATTYSPDASLSRAEFTALLVRALGLKSTALASFTDVKKGDWFAADVAAASEAGLIQGIGKGKFAPHDKVSRQDLAVILERALKLAGIELTTDQTVAYTDLAHAAAYARESIQKLTNAGVLNGYLLSGKTYYQPNAPADREFAAVALYQWLLKAKLMNGFDLS